MTVRPALVFIRTRNPCVFERRRRLGWNVRLGMKSRALLSLSAAVFFSGSCCQPVLLLSAGPGREVSRRRTWSWHSESQRRKSINDGSPAGKPCGAKWADGKTIRRRFGAWTQGSATAPPTTCKTDKTDGSESEKEARSEPPSLPSAVRRRGVPSESLVARKAAEVRATLRAEPGRVQARRKVQSAWPEWPTASAALALTG